MAPISPRIASYGGIHVRSRQGHQRSRRQPRRAVSRRHGGQRRRRRLVGRRGSAQPGAAGDGRHRLSHLFDDQGRRQHGSDDPDRPRQAERRHGRRNHPARVRRAEGAGRIRRKAPEAARAAHQGDRAPSGDAHLGPGLRVLEHRSAALHGGDRSADDPLRADRCAQVPAPVRSGRALGLRHRHRLAGPHRREGRWAFHRSASARTRSSIR